MNPDDPPQRDLQLPPPTQCPRCGGVVALGAQYCPTCGSAVAGHAPPPLPPIDYRQPAPMARPSGSGVRPFMLGLLAGSVLSGAVYGSLMMSSGLPPALPVVLIGSVIVIKIAAIIWAFVTRRRALGAGLVTSIPIAILIFIVGCFSALIQAEQAGHH